MIKIEDIISYIETKAATNSYLSGNIHVAFPGNPMPPIKQYGIRIYFENDNWLAIERKKIGNIVSETYTVNVDLVFNRDLTPRKVFSDTMGISYWSYAMVNLFINKNNNGMFKDSYWAPSEKMETGGAAIILKGNLIIKLENIYT